ncbi:MAG TPA: class I SAM-dependent methyltransferase [Firmicutes bacterium]|nr:class I SAM-dependent methyltransferase [Bacillota bacterium]
MTADDRARHRLQVAGLPPAGEEKTGYVRAAFDAIARGYDLMNLIMTAGLVRYWRRAFARVTGLQPGGRALDVCCGTGELAFIMAEQVRPRWAGPSPTTTEEGKGQVVGVDFSPRMLARAQEKASRRGIAISLMLADALSLPFPEDCFDCASIGFALRNVNDIAACLREMVRVVKPGGRVVSLEICHPVSLWVKIWFYPYFRGLVPALGWLAERLQGTGRSHGTPRPQGAAQPQDAAQPLRGLRPYAYLPRSLAYLPGVRELAETMEQAGLQEVRWWILPPGVVALHWGVKPW